MKSSRSAALCVLHRRLRIAKIAGALALLLGGAALARAQATTKLPFIPLPREVRETGLTPLSAGIRVKVSGDDPEDQFSADDLAVTLKERDIPIASGADGVTIEMLRADSKRGEELLREAHLTFNDDMRGEGYVIVPVEQGAAVIAGSASGIFYGVQTLKQCITGTAEAAVLHRAVIRDWPAMRWRGMSDDLSRGPIAKLEFQKQQIRTFAGYKLNVYSPYFENTLSFASHPLGAAPDGSMSLDDLRTLVAYAALYHVTVIPEQESFGHLHNLLLQEEYSSLAETPHGSVLAPGDPGSVPLIRDWFSEISSVSPGPFLHIGADETFELGKGRTAADVKARGLGVVYVDFLARIDAALKPLGKRLLFWGDVAMNEPALVPRIPKDMVAVPWVYDPQPKGFDQFILPFRQAGMETWVAPSVNNWSKVVPDYMRGLLNVQQFVRDGQRLGAVGMLNTAWNDDGEGLFNLDWYGVLFGAAAGWQPGESSLANFQASYGAVFHGDVSGKIDRAMLELMSAQTLLSEDPYLGQTDRLYWLDPWSTPGQAEAKRIRPHLHELRMHAEKALELIAEARRKRLHETDTLDALEMGARRLDLIGLKFQLSDEIAANYSKALAAAAAHAKTEDIETFLYEIADTNGRCQDLRNSYSTGRDLYERAWERENRPFALARVLGQYDLATQLWITRANTIANVMDNLELGGQLPSAETLGIPQAAP